VIFILTTQKKDVILNKIITINSDLFLKGNPVKVRNDPVTVSRCVLLYKPLGKPGKVEVKSGKSGDLLLIAIITLFEERELLPAYGKAPFPKYYPK